MKDNTNANYNIAIGTQALEDINGSNATNNTVIGWFAGGRVTTGANNTLLGYRAGTTTLSGGANLTTGDNNIIIGYSAESAGAGTDNQIVIGNTSNNTLKIGGDLLEASNNAVTQSGCFYENNTTVSSDYTITNGRNAMAAGPITIASGVTVTVGSGETLTIV